ncbi:uncharacterized protein LOC113374011 [Ctenocephalides felis]|uniref:uncharacterized protein LOC113374011 n=1 Tax=Ctenocephalides felis TaxID=7515 RepID=UPI000E6E3A5E|nr:uncharacterized protein LOC113374011 [Ctenocephalides felis]
MAANTISTDVQIRYLLQWFSEWSDLQRSDFLPILAEQIGSSSNSVYMNGVVNSLANATCDDKPMNLFQCRVKLFRGWTANWTADEMKRLAEKFSEIDSSFGEKLADELSPKTNKDDKTENPPEPAEPQGIEDVTENINAVDNVDKSMITA